MFRSGGNPHHKGSGPGGGQFASGGGAGSGHGKHWTKRQRRKQKLLEKLRHEGHAKIAKVKAKQRKERHDLRAKHRASKTSFADRRTETKSLKERHSAERQETVKGLKSEARKATAGLTSKSGKSDKAKEFAERREKGSAKLGEIHAKERGEMHERQSGEREKLQAGHNAERKELVGKARQERQEMRGEHNADRMKLVEAHQGYHREDARYTLKQMKGKSPEERQAALKDVRDTHQGRLKEEMKSQRESHGSQIEGHREAVRQEHNDLRQSQHEERRDQHQAHIGAQRIVGKLQRGERREAIGKLKEEIKSRGYDNGQAVQTAYPSESRAATDPRRFAATRVHKASSAESILKHCLRQLGYTKRWKNGRLTGRQHLRLLEAIRQYGRTWMRHEAESFFQHYGVKDDIGRNTRMGDVERFGESSATSRSEDILGSKLRDNLSGDQGTQRAIAGSIISPLRRWFDRAKQFVRELIFAGAMSLSGDRPLAAEETDQLDRQAQIQADYLAGFMHDIEVSPPPEIAAAQPIGFPSDVYIIGQPKPATVAQVAARAELYGNSAWQSGQRLIRLRAHRDVKEAYDPDDPDAIDLVAEPPGVLLPYPVARPPKKARPAFKYERRVLGHPKTHHCHDCPPLAAMGWVPLGTLPDIGDSECDGLCLCHFEYTDDPGTGKAHPVPGKAPDKRPRLSRFGPTNAQIITDPDQDPLKVGKDVISKSVSLNDLASLSGATDSGKVYIYAAGHKIELSVADPKYTAYRVISRDKDGSLVMKAAAFHVHEGEQGKGIGQEVFGRMVETGERLGVNRITTDAARSSTENGYYTWPRFGYDGPLSVVIKDKLPQGLRSAQTVQDLFTSQEGRDWWRINGESTQMTFDLEPGSLSQQRWEAYRRAKLEQSNVTSPMPISEPPTKLGPGISKEPRIKVSPSSEGPDYEYWEIE